MMRRLCGAVWLLAVGTGFAQGGPDLGFQIGALVAEPAVVRAHWGVAVMSLDGERLYGWNDAQLFQPASNAKLFTTAAAMALLGPGRTFTTRVTAAGPVGPDGVLAGDLRLVGGGDANLSGRVFPYTPPVPGVKVQEVDPLRYLADMADEVVAKGVKVVQGDVVGDDTHFAWEPYGADWAVDDLPWGYGAPVSALAVNDDQVILTVTPGAAATEHPAVTMDPAVPYYTVKNEAWSSNPAKGPIGLDRAPGSKEIRVFGGIAVGAAPHKEEMAILDPAEYAAMALRRLLQERGVTVQGAARAAHWAPADVSGFLEASRRPIPAAVFAAHLNRESAPVACPATGGTVLATHVSPPLVEDVVWTNKVSQNLHAEMMLRDLGAELSGGCVGSLRTGEQALRQFLVQAGIDKDDFVFFDGSGLSGHDLVTPRATAALLAYAARQPWFAAWKASLPVGGVDGSLHGRFAKLAGRVFAKTGTLGEARALSGYVVGASGRTVIFSVMVGNHAPGTNADRDVMDRIVTAIAAAN